MTRESFRIYRTDGDYRYPGGHDNTGLNTLHEAEKDAECGSHALREATEKAFWKFAWKHKISEQEARILLLNTGIRLPRITSFLLGQAA